MSSPDRLSFSQLFRGIGVVAGREIASYFDSSIAYVYAIAFVLLSNSIFMNDFFLSGRLEMTGFFDLMPLLLAFFLPAITMRLWAEERRQRTLELLLTLPIQPTQAVIGKYLAAFALYLLFLGGSLPIVAMLCVLGSPDLGLIVSGYLGLLFLGTLFLTLGMCLSALTSDQIVAFVMSTVAAYLLILFGNEKVVAILDGLAPRLSPGTLLNDSIAVLPHYEAFTGGLVQLASVVYFVGFGALFLWCNGLLLVRSRR